MAPTISGFVRVPRRMARRDELLELLRPPAHRGPLIAAGTVLFTVGIALEELRLADELPNAFTS